MSTNDNHITDDNTTNDNHITDNNTTNNNHITDDVSNESMMHADIKKSKLDKDADIYNKERPDKIVKGQFKNMTFKEKLIHLKVYYLKIAIAVVIIAVLIGTVILLNNKRDKSETTFYCGMLNNISFEFLTQSDMPADFAEYLKSREDFKGPFNEKKIYINTFKTDIFDTSRIDGYFDHNIFDAFVLNSTVFKNYVSINALTDLTTIFTEEELAELDSRLVYVIDSKTGNSTPYGVLLDDTKYEFYYGTRVIEEGPIYAIPTCATHIEAAKYFLSYLLEQ